MTARNGKPAIAVITWGSFSSANERFLDSFRSMLPSYDVDVVDVFALMSREESAFYRRGRLHAWREFTRVLLSKREPMRGAGGCFIRSRFYSDWVRRRLIECLSKRRYAFSLQTQSLFDARVPGIPHFVYTDHAELQCLELPGFSRKDLFPASWIARETSLYLDASAVFTMSQRTRECLIEAYGCPEERVAWVKAGQNANPGLAAPPSRYAKKRILFVGTKWELKGGPDLVAAYEKVLQTHPDAELKVVGCSPDLQLPGCEVVGPVPVDVVGDHYNQASVLCVPTTREAYGFSFIEAHAHGLPVVATRVGALPELVSEGETGYLVDVGDVNGLAERLTGMLGDPETLRRLGTNAQRQGLLLHVGRNRPRHAPAHRANGWRPGMTAHVRSADVHPELAELLEQQPYTVSMDGLTITVDPDVFPPDLGRCARNMARVCREYAPRRALDMGCGTGYLALALRHQLVPEVWAVDLHEPAVACTSRNVDQNPGIGRVDVLLSDLFEAIPPSVRFDLIVFNQPFAPAESQSVCGCGADGGYEITRRFLAEAPAHMADGGRVVMPFSDRAAPVNDPAAVARELGHLVRTLLHAYYGSANNFVYEILPS